MMEEGRIHKFATNGHSCEAENGARSKVRLLPGHQKHPKLRGSISKKKKKKIPSNLIKQLHR